MNNTIFLICVVVVSVLIGGVVGYCIGREGEQFDLPPCQNTDCPFHDEKCGIDGCGGYEK